MGRRALQRKRERITQDVFLDILKAGTTLAVSLVAPNAIKMLDSFSKDKKEWNRYYRSSLEKQTVKLWRKGIVEVKKGKEGYNVIITDKGKKEILKYDVDNLTIPSQNQWDGKWRMVLFDIESGHEVERKLFRRKIKTMGFFRMQKSVYVYPFPCYKQIQFLREIYSIPHSVKLATVEHLENDEDLRRVFQI